MDFSSESLGREYVRAKLFKQGSVCESLKDLSSKVRNIQVEKEEGDFGRQGPEQEGRSTKPGPLVYSV